MVTSLSFLGGRGTKIGSSPSQSPRRGRVIMMAAQTAVQLAVAAVGTPPASCLQLRTAR